MKVKHWIFLTGVVISLLPLPSRAQSLIELNSGWKCAPIGAVKESGELISTSQVDIKDWITATVPGTVLTTMLDHQLVPDPFYGMNNEKIPDIYETGRDYYTYWFVNEFEVTANSNEQVWLKFRGINYSCDVFLNGTKLNETLHKGMFLRQQYNITSQIQKGKKNRLAVIVYPPDPVGNPNGGQGGDGVIAKNNSHQYVAGWDWIQPIRDRNTGIWDKVFLEKTGSINIKNPQVITKVPGKRNPKAASQASATILVNTELENPTNKDIQGTLSLSLNGETINRRVTVKAGSTEQFSLPDFTVQNPKLWWPNMYGPQNLYDLELTFAVKKEVTDTEKVTFGIREVTREWNSHTQSMQINVNGQKIFIKGGNWIISDAMLRFTPERYDAEIRFHRDMNLNLIRIWGGALTERPEFYQACDKYGMLVIQDFWMSGDCNGKWLDPKKLEDQWTRRKYPDDHSLFEESARDMVKMIRNHPSLAIYCGGNEITPPLDLLEALENDILPEVDGTRWFIPYSNSDSMSFNTIGGNGDGPYTIQEKNLFWDYKTWPFNSEVGSVGVGDIQSLKRFIPDANLTPPTFDDETVDSVWAYHKYIGYEHHIRPYGDAEDAEDFGWKAQLVNYDQYRALMEGFSSHMWDWYTGTIIWKTQNPWTALRGQMYDYYLDPNACLYGLRKGGSPLSVAYNPTTGMVMTINNSFEPFPTMMLRISTIDMEGNQKLYTQVDVEVLATSVKPYLSVKKLLEKEAKEQGVFLKLELLDWDQNVLADNFYWVPNGDGNYSGLNNLAKTKLKANAEYLEEGKIKVSLANATQQPVAFFNRVSLVDATGKERLLPVFYDDNYVSVLGGETKEVLIEYDPKEIGDGAKVSVEGWNVNYTLVNIR